MRHPGAAPKRSASALAGLLALAGSAACGTDASVARAGASPDAELALQAMDAYGCGSCHVIPGLRAARGKAGPPLTAWAERDFIAGAVPNTPENLVRWIVEPDAIEPGTAMPDVGVSVDEARLMAAYLFTLREAEEGA